MHRPLGRRRVLPAALVAALALAGSASAAVIDLPADGSQVNDDPAIGIDPNQDAGVSDVVGGALTPGAPAVPWAAFEQKHGSAQQIFVRAFKGGAWHTQGQSLNIQANQQAEAPAIDFAGTGRSVPWATWYEPNSNLGGGKTQIFASRFSAASGNWIPEGQDRTASSRVPSLNIHTNQDAENPAIAGGAAVAGNSPVPWIAWQEEDGSSPRDQIFVSRGIATPGGDCSANQPNSPGSKQSVGNFCWQQVGNKRVDASSLSFDPAGDPSLNIDPKRDGIEPDFAFTGPGDTVPWVVWYETGNGTPGLRTNEQVFAAKAVPDPSADGKFHWVAVGNGTAGQTNVLDATGGCSSSQGQEDRCALNVAPGHDAEDPRVAAGTLTPGGVTVPWVVWVEDNGSGIHQVFVSRLVGDHFELFNDGQPISNILNDATRPDITFSGHTPYISWVEDTNGSAAGGERTFVGHFEGPAFKLDTTAGAVANIRSPISSNCIATPFNADGDACQGNAVGTPYFLHLDHVRGADRLFAKAYHPTSVTTAAASAVTSSSATLAGAVDPGGAPAKAFFEYGTTTAYGSQTPLQAIGPAVGPQAIAAQLTGLPASTTIHYRLVVQTDFATVTGGDATLTTQPAPPAPDTRAPRLKLLGGKSLKLDRHGRLTLKLRSDEAAKGDVTLRTARRGLGTIGHVDVRLAAGRTATVKVKLTRAARRLVHRQHSLRAVEALRVRDAAGNAATASRKLTVKG